MRIGFIVDGDGEVKSLPRLLVRIDSPHELLPTAVKGDIQPKAEPTRIARAASRACESLAQRHVDLAVLLLDLEDRVGCPGALAADLRRLITQRLSRLGIAMDIQVVFKVRAFENWLVADLQSLQAFPGLFPQLARTRRTVPAGNADGVDALAILRRAAGQHGSYHKVRGSIVACTYLDPGRAALNSRSFRRFLRVLGDSRYVDQSRLPNPEA